MPVGHAGVNVTNLEDPRNMRLGVAGGRLVEDGGELRYRRFASDAIEIDGSYLEIPVGDLTAFISDELIDSNGDDTGLFPLGQTRMYAYVSGPSAANRPNSLLLSNSAPVYYNGFRYLGAAGAARQYRFVGWIGTDAVPSFQDTDTDRLVVNCYNRLRKSIRVVPAYLNDAAQTTYALTAATWARINAGTADQVRVLSNGEDAIDVLLAVGISSMGAGVSMFGIGVDSDVTPAAACLVRASSSNIVASCRHSAVLADGFHTLRMLGFTNNLAATIIADEARNGSASDPAVTMLVGTVMT